MFKNRLKKIAEGSWFITLFATTLGVLLALYLNNLNDRSKTEHRKQISVQNLSNELTNNQNELLDSEDNERLIKFLTEVSEIDPEIPNRITIPVTTMNALRKEYQGFMRITDSIEVEADQYQYHVAYQFELNLDDLQHIAWETSKMSDITHELDYECLQIFVKIYALQDLYTREQQKILDQFVNAQHVKLLGALRIVQQLKIQLLNAITEGQDKIKNCG
jgi:hypothetical protein